MINKVTGNSEEKQPSRGAFRKMCSENMQQIFFCNFIETTLQHGCSPVNALHIFRTPFPNSTSGRLLLSEITGTSVSNLAQLEQCNTFSESFIITRKSGRK